MGYRHSREEMLAAAVAVATDSGIGGLTYSAVAARLGISDRMVVYYFPSKADLVVAVVGAMGSRLEEVLEQAFGATARPVRDLQRRAWPVLASPASDPVFAVYFEVIGLASARTEPFASLAPILIDDWVEWLVPRIAGGSPARRRQQALASVATLDGLLLLRRVAGSRAANAAARELGIAD